MGRIERNTDKDLSEYCKKGASVNSGRARKATLERYSELSGTIVPEWEGTSAVERLTGQSYPEFLDLILGEKNYIFTE